MDCMNGTMKMIPTIGPSTNGAGTPARKYMSVKKHASMKQMVMRPRTKPAMARSILLRMYVLRSRWDSGMKDSEKVSTLAQPVEKK